MHVDDVRPHDEDRAGRTPPCDRVDDDQHVDRLEQLVHEVDATDAHVEHADAGWQALFQQACRDRGTEAVVASEQVAEAGDQCVHHPYDTAVPPVDEAVAELRRRLDRHPADRYPVQHATARFHLGAMLLERNEPEAAAAELAHAIALFEKLPAEQAKARNLWGAARRATGHLEDSAAAFADAAEAFQLAGLPLEQAAALFNLGLVRLQLGEADTAAADLALAAETFDRQGVRAQAAAAVREQGAALMTSGRHDEAVAVLSDALDRAERTGPDAGRGQAANALGLALLATGDTAGAVTTLRRAVAAHPVGIRPVAHAMAKANLALAYETAGDRPRARLAAAQVLAGAHEAGPVRDQAAAVLARLGPPGDDLVAVLGDEAEERWVAVIREEAARWLRLGATADIGDTGVTAIVDAIEGDRGPAVAEAWLHVLLEAPPDLMTQLVRMAWRVAANRNAFARVVRDAIVTFPPPQLFRLEAVFAAETGIDPRR